MSDEQLVNVKAAISASGGTAELQVHKEVASLLPKLFPGMAAKRRARSIVAGKVLQKLSDGVSLDAADLEYAEAIFGEVELKWARRQAIEARAARLLQDESFVRRLPPSSAEEGAAEGGEAPNGGEPSNNASEKIIDFFVRTAKHRPEIKLAHAQLPYLNWTGDAGELDWTEVLSGNDAPATSGGAATDATNI